jgi:hypothetical protein
MGQATAPHVPPKNPPQQQDPTRSNDPGTGLMTNDSMQHPEQPADPMGNDHSVKSSSINVQLVRAMRKEAKKEVGKGKEPHYVRRALLGTPISAAVEAKKGKKLRAFGETYLHSLKEGLKGLGAGGAGGAGLGALAGLLSKGKLKPGAGALYGGALGGGAGSVVGGVKGQFERKATELHGKYASAADFLRLVKKAEEEMAEEEGKASPPPPTKEKKEESKEKESAGSKCAGVDPRLVDYFMDLKKQAEDAINPAQVSGTPGGPGEQPPPGASASGEQVPSEPADVNKQKSMIDSNQAAIDYTKGQAKADPKSDVDKVLTEPALSAAHDSALQKNLDHTGEAGVKISHAVKTAATRALLEKLAAEAKDEKSKGKEKDSQGMAGGQMFTAPGVQSGTGPSPAP